jgi:hypothetical protein
MVPVQEGETTAPVHDYFAAETPQHTPEFGPIEEPQVAQPAPEPVIHSVPLMAPAPVEEPAVELPTMAPPPEPELEPELAPAAIVEAQPVELAPLAPIAPDPAPEPAPVDLTVVQPEPAAPPLEPALSAVEPAIAAEAEIAPATELEELFSPKRTGFQIVVRLKEAEGVVIGSFRDFGTAMEGAQEVIEQFSTATEGQWPFYAGRFIRPDLIVSVDVVEGNGTDES